MIPKDIAIYRSFIAFQLGEKIGKCEIFRKLDRLHWWAEEKQCSVVNGGFISVAGTHV